MDALLRRRIMMMMGEAPTPPEPPTPTTNIPYIRNTNCTEYIDTGITADDSTRIIIWARNVNPAGVVLCGSRVATTTSTYGIFMPSGSPNYNSLRIDYGTEQKLVKDAFTKMSSYHKYELNGPDFYVDDVLVTSATAATFSNDCNIFLFAINTNNSTVDYAERPIDICACKIYKNDVLVRDYTPVNSPSIGLYDAVSETVFTNSGTGSFTYGSFDPDAYTELEYISATIEQYFDIGIKGGYAVPMILAYMPTGTGKKWSYLVGARTTPSSKRCEFAIGNGDYNNARAYFNYQGTSSQLKTTSTNNFFNDKKMVYMKKNNKAWLCVDNSQQGTVTGTAGTTFETEYNIYLGGVNTAGTITAASYGRFYYAGFGSLRNFVPALVNNVAGMYDTYNDTFYRSTSGVDFIAPTT